MQRYRLLEPPGFIHGEVQKTIVEFQGKKYKRVKRIAEVGELIEITSNVNSSWLLGEVGEVKQKTRALEVCGKRYASWLTSEQYVVLEFIDERKQTAIQLIREMLKLHRSSKNDELLTHLKNIDALQYAIDVLEKQPE